MTRVTTLIIGIGNLPPDTTERDLNSLFDQSPCIKTIRLVKEGSHERVLALVDMDVSIEEAEAIQHRFHRRWWHDRLINVSVMFH